MEEHILALMKEYMKALGVRGEAVDGGTDEARLNLVGHLVIARTISDITGELGGYIEDQTEALRELTQELRRDKREDTGSTLREDMLEAAMKRTEDELKGEELARAMKKMDLIEAGSDADGDFFPVDVLEAMVEGWLADDTKIVPVTIGFDRDERVGYVEGMSMEHGKVKAHIVVDYLKLPEDLNEYELAAGGIVERGANTSRIKSFELTEVALTEKKAHTKKLAVAKEAEEPGPHDLREALAALAHERWSRWMRSMIPNMNNENLERWRRQMNTPYEELSEKEKDSNREEADVTIELLKKKNALVVPSV